MRSVLVVVGGTVALVVLCIGLGVGIRALSLQTFHPHGSYDGYAIELRELRLVDGTRCVALFAGPRGGLTCDFRPTNERGERDAKEQLERAPVSR